MVLYFSATGNSKFAASYIAKGLHDTLVDLLPYIKANKPLTVDSDAPIIFCLPVSVCAMPTYVKRYLKQVTCTPGQLVYFVFTNGGYDGISPMDGYLFAKKQKLNYKGSFSLKMPRNYTVSTQYKLNSPEEIAEIVEQARQELDRILTVIKERKKASHRHIFLFEYLITIPFVPIYAKLGFSAKPFYATDSCIGCGLCERKCPLNAIEIVNRKPVWNSDSCAHCMSCINNCPKKAIEYGDVTANLNRYTFDFRKFDA